MAARMCIDLGRPVTIFHHVSEVNRVKKTLGEQYCTFGPVVEFMAWVKAGRSARVEEMIRQLEATRVRESVPSTGPSNLVLGQPMDESQGEWTAINREEFGSNSFRRFRPVRQRGLCRRRVYCKFANQWVVSVQWTWVVSSTCSDHFNTSHSKNWVRQNEDTFWGGKHCWCDHVSQMLPPFAKRATCVVDTNIVLGTRRATQCCCNNVSFFCRGQCRTCEHFNSYESFIISPQVFL